MQGFDADHQEIDLLRLRNFTIGRKLEEAEVTAPDFLERVARLLTCMEPYVCELHIPTRGCHESLNVAGGVVVGELPDACIP